MACLNWAPSRSLYQKRGNPLSLATMTRKLLLVLPVVAVGRKACTTVQATEVGEDGKGMRGGERYHRRGSR